MTTLTKTMRLRIKGAIKDRKVSIAQDLIKKGSFEPLIAERKYKQLNRAKDRFFRAPRARATKTAAKILHELFQNNPNLEVIAQNIDLNGFVYGLIIFKDEGFQLKNLYGKKLKEEMKEIENAEELSWQNIVKEIGESK